MALFRPGLMRALVLLLIVPAHLALFIHVPAHGSGITAHTAIFLPVISGGSAPPSSGLLLTDGGVVRGVDGVTIAAVQGALSEPRELTVAQTTLPSLPIPGGATAHGSAYEIISPIRDAYARGAVTFIVGLPLPPGVAQAHLGIALYKPEGDDGPDDWFFLPGLVDGDHNLLLAALPHLAQQGYTAVLVEHPALQSPANIPPSTAQANKAHQSQAVKFHVICVIEDEGLRDFCEIDKVHVEDKLLENKNDFTGIGYPEPALYTQAEAFNIVNPTVIEGNSYVVTINLECRGHEDKWAGFYLPLLQQLTLCRIPNAPLNSIYLQTMRHELFHATQLAYPATWIDWTSKKWEGWVIEAVATTSEESDGLGVHRDPTRSLHVVDRSLKSDEGTDEYSAQDFWVRLAQLNPGSGLGRFTTLFQQGAGTDAVIDFIGSKEGLRNQYWGWVKNQVMVEDNIDFDGVLGQPCLLQTSSVETIHTFDPYNDGSYPPIPQPPANLTAMTSHVIELIIDPELEGFPQLTVWVNNPNQDDPDLRFKVYVEGETCTSIPDGARKLHNVTAAKKYYVVIANTDTGKDRTYTIFID